VTSFTVARAALAPALARAAAIVPGRSPIAIIGCVLLEASDEGLRVVATDMDIVYRETVDALPRETWRGCVDAERLEAFVAGAPPDGEVALRPDDEGRLNIRCGRAACRLPVLPAEDFPIFNRPNEGAVELALDAAAFAAGLRAVAPVMSDEKKARYYLCGAFLEEAGRLVTTDGKRLAVRTVAADTPEAPNVIIPDATVTRLAGLLRGVEGAIAVTVSRTQIIVGTSHWTLTSKLIDGTYPDYRRVLPERSSCPLVVRRGLLRNASALVAAIEHGDKVRGLHLATKGDELLVASDGDDALGACEVMVPIEVAPSAAELLVGLNHRYLISALDAIDTELVELHIGTDPGQPVWVCAPGEAHDGSVIMPLRV
jgi:DNA polymerase-3 subunit beta